MCQLCEVDFVTTQDFARHKQHRHAGEAEYRKRVPFLMAEAGCRLIAVQEGSRGNRPPGGQAVSRCEAACVVCAQKYYLEHRHKLSLFGAVPQGHLSEHCADPVSDHEDDRRRPS